MKIGYIYKITSPTGKIYIGQTRRPIELRKREYSKGMTKNQILLHRSLQYHSWDMHKFEILEILKSEEYIKQILNALEIYYIGLYKCNKARYKNGNGLNLSDGGSRQYPKAKRIACYNLDGTLFKIFDSYIDILAYYKIKYSGCISRSIKNKSSAFNKYWSYDTEISIKDIKEKWSGANKKAVVAINNDGSIYKRFSSIKDVLLEMDMATNYTSYITNAIKGNHKSLGKYWILEKDISNINEIKKNWKKEGKKVNNI